MFVTSIKLSYTIHRDYHNINCNNFERKTLNRRLPIKTFTEHFQRKKVFCVKNLCVLEAQQTLSSFFFQKKDRAPNTRLDFCLVCQS